MKHCTTLQPLWVSLEKDIFHKANPMKKDNTVLASLQLFSDRNGVASKRQIPFKSKNIDCKLIYIPLTNFHGT
jgi:hypothetical protein